PGVEGPNRTGCPRSTTHRGNSDKSVTSRSTGRSSSRIGLAGCESPPAAGVPDILSGSGTEPNAAGAAVAPSATADAAAVPRGFDDTQPREAAVAAALRVPAALGSTPDGVGRRHVLVRIAGDLVPPDALAVPAADSVQSVVAVALRVPALVCPAPAGAPEKHAPVAASAVAG